MKKLLVLLAAVAFVVAFTVPAMSADWSFYGSSRMTTFFDSDSEELSASGLYDDDDLTWDLQGNSRLGATVKAGAIAGGFEYGSGPNLRKLYGTWNFGSGQLLVGQTYTPVNDFSSNRVWGGDEDLLNSGGIYAGRDPMIQLSLGTFKIALIKPNAPGGVVAAETDTSLPRIEASYAFKAGSFSLTPMLGYSTYDEVNATNKEYGIDSYIAALVLSVNLGPAYIKGNVYMGQNLRQYGFGYLGWVDDSAAYDIANDKIIDNDNMGYLAVVGFKASDALTIEFGYGYAEGERDVSGSKADEVCSYYANATVNIAKGFFVVPEIGKIDQKEDAAGNDQGDTTYFGAKWQINF